MRFDTEIDDIIAQPPQKHRTKEDSDRVHDHSIFV